MLADPERVILSEASRTFIARSGVEGSAVSRLSHIPNRRSFDFALARYAQDDTFMKIIRNWFI
jgi:hypothetical protein